MTPWISLFSVDISMIFLLFYSTQNRKVLVKAQLIKLMKGCPAMQNNRLKDCSSKLKPLLYLFEFWKMFNVICLQLKSTCFGMKRHCKKVVIFYVHSISQDLGTGWDFTLQETKQTEVSKVVFGCNCEMSLCELLNCLINGLTVTQHAGNRGLQHS